MPENIEIKVRVESLADAHRKAAKLSDSPPQQINQEDIFYRTERGRLKLRRDADGNGRLIYYQRPDHSGPKLSTFKIYETRNPDQLHQVLAIAIGVRGMVKKQRWLYKLGNDRIHVDDVQGLGAFMEIELVIEEHRSRGEARKRTSELMAQLGIDQEQLVDSAYIDLMED